MSADYYRRQIQQHQKEIGRLQLDKSREAQKVANTNRLANSSAEAAARASTAAARQSRLRDVEKYQRDIANSQKRIADLEARIAREQTKIAELEKKLAWELERELKARQREEEKRARAHEQRMRTISTTLSRHDAMHEHALTELERLSRLPESITVLFMAANPLDQNQLRLDEEARAIGDMIRKSEHRDAVKLESRWAVRPLDVLQAINECRPRIVHFSGHGSDRDELVLQDDSGTTKIVSKEAIVQAMATTADGISLVFLNTCYSRNQAEAVVQHVPAAIGMNASIGDMAARTFAAQFYSAIGFGLSVTQAFAQARAALMLESIPEEDTPELVLGPGVNGDELILVKPPVR